MYKRVQLFDVAQNHTGVMINIDLSGNWADELLAGMQGPAQREGMKKAFEATPEELGKAAVEAAQKQENENPNPNDGYGGFGRTAQND